MFQIPPWGRGDWRIEFSAGITLGGSISKKYILGKRKLRYHYINPRKIERIFKILGEIAFALDLTIGRFFVGIQAGCSLCLLPLFIIEASPHRNRPFLSSLQVGAMPNSKISYFLGFMVLTFDRPIHLRSSIAHFEGQYHSFWMAHRWTYMDGSITIYKQKIKGISQKTAF